MQRQGYGKGVGVLARDGVGGFFVPAARPALPTAALQTHRAGRFHPQVKGDAVRVATLELAMEVPCGAQQRLQGGDAEAARQGQRIRDQMLAIDQAADQARHWTARIAASDQEQERSKPGATHGAVRVAHVGGLGGAGHLTAWRRCARAHHLGSLRFGRALRVAADAGVGFCG